MGRLRGSPNQTRAKVYAVLTGLEGRMPYALLLFDNEVPGVIGCRLVSDASGIIRTKPLGDFLILLARPVEMVGKPSNAPDPLPGLLFPNGVLQTCLVSEP